MGDQVPGPGAMYLADTYDVEIHNCTFGDNVTWNDYPGGILVVGNVNVSVTNSILWGNVGGSEPQLSGAATVNFSNIEGGWTGNGSNNQDADPLFDNEYLLGDFSPSRDAGDTDLLPCDVYDLAPQLFTECPFDENLPRLPIDLAGEIRVVNCMVDQGAFEHEHVGCANLNGDDAVNVSDLLLLLGAWGPCPECPTTCPEDQNGDGVVKRFGPAHFAGCLGRSRWVRNDFRRVRSGNRDGLLEPLSGRK